MIGPLFVKVVAAPSVHRGNKALALCTEDGQLVGQQISCTVHSEVNDVATVTVRFYIDNETICFGDNDG